MNRRSSVKIALRASGTLALLACLFMASSAGAAPGVPVYLQSKYGLSCAPTCLLCHSDPNGGLAFRDAITPSGQVVPSGFIATLLTNGFDPYDDTHVKWDAAFSAVEQKNLDTDQDGTPDIQEFKNGTDPNNGQDPNAQICGSGPTYGCVRVARGTDVDGVALVVSSSVLALGIALARRRRH